MSADVVFTNASVFLPEGSPFADTVAVRRGRIIAVARGLDRDLVGPHTEVLDLRGATLLPGFIDAHVHPIAAGLQALRCDLSTLPHDRAAYRKAIAEYARAHPDETVIAGSGWYGDAFDGGFPSAGDIDDIVGDRAVVLSSHDGHGVWATVGRSNSPPSTSTRPTRLAAASFATASVDPRGCCSIAQPNR